MNTKKILVMALALTACTGVFARGHHHHHSRGLDLAAGIVGLTAATVAIANDIVAPDPVVVAQPTVVAPAPVVVTQPTVVAPAPAVVAPAAAVVTPTHTVFTGAPVAYPRPYRHRHFRRRW